MIDWLNNQPNCYCYKEFIKHGYVRLWDTVRDWMKSILFSHFYATILLWNKSTDFKITESFLPVEILRFSDNSKKKNILNRHLQRNSTNFCKYTFKKSESTSYVSPHNVKYEAASNIRQLPVSHWSIYRKISESVRNITKILIKIKM